MKKYIHLAGIFTFIVSLSILSESCKKKEFKVVKGILNMERLEADYTKASEAGSIISVESKIKDESRATFNNESAKLGRVLFYDKNLSINNNIACGGCHVQSMAFADGTKASSGFASDETPRNSMAILNVADNNNMFWDSRSNSPLDMSLKPIFNHLEMGMESDEMLVSKLQSISYYPEMFEKAFGSSNVTKENIAHAISHFLSSIYSKNSKFDKELPNNFQGYTALEKYGKALFDSDRLMCNSCHNVESNFSAPDFPGGPYGSSNGGFGTGIAPHNNNFIDPNDPRGTTNIGLDLVYKDNGKNNGAFKIPSLRNIELTGPYMHDGRFNTLSDVIDHYSHGIQNHPNLDPKFRFNGKAKKLNISEAEKTALVAFLKTLTDKSLLSDPRYSDPFEYK